MGTDHHIHILRRAGQQGFKRIRRQQIVAIHKRDPLAPRMRKAEVARRADPLIFLRKDMEARVPFGIAARQRQRIVREPSSTKTTSKSRMLWASRLSRQALKYAPAL